MANDETPSELIRAKDVVGFDLWSLPSFDPERPAPEPAADVIELAHESEDVPLDEVQPMTLEELESIRQEAYNEGFATGEKDGFHSAQIKVRQEAEVVLAAKLASLEQLMAHLMTPIAEQDQLIEHGMIRLIEHMTREVIQREMTIDSSQILKVLRDALKLLPMGAENLSIFINPADFEQVKALRDRHDEKWRIVEDEALHAGGCRIETLQSRIDASMETRISLAVAKLFDQLYEQVLSPAPADTVLELDDAHSPATTPGPAPEGE